MDYSDLGPAPALGDVGNWRKRPDRNAPSAARNSGAASHSLFCPAADQATDTNDSKSRYYEALLPKVKPSAGNLPAYSLVNASHYCRSTPQYPSPFRGST